MMFRAIICCVALIAGLLAALNVTAESAGACSGTACGSSGKPQPLNLMNFMNGSGQSSSSQSNSGQAAAVTSTAPAKSPSAKRRHHKAKAVARSNSEAVSAPAAASESPALPAAASEQPALPAAATAALAATAPDDVQVVSGDEVNAIDLAMGKASGPAAETNGVSPGAENDNRDSIKWADAKEFRAEQFKPSAEPAPAKVPTSDSAMRDDSWMGRFWSAIGDGYVALIAMIKQLFG
jgi:hypothetical protein